LQGGAMQSYLRFRKGEKRVRLCVFHSGVLFFALPSTQCALFIAKKKKMSHRRFTCHSLLCPPLLLHNWDSITCHGKKKKNVLLRLISAEFSLERRSSKESGGDARFFRCSFFIPLISSVERDDKALQIASVKEKGQGTLGVVVTLFKPRILLLNSPLSLVIAYVGSHPFSLLYVHTLTRKTRRLARTYIPVSFVIIIVFPAFFHHHSCTEAETSPTDISFATGFSFLFVTSAHRPSSAVFVCMCVLFLSLFSLILFKCDAAKQVSSLSLFFPYYALFFASKLFFFSF
jgi:hypothetical protein